MIRHEKDQFLDCLKNSKRKFKLCWKNGKSFKNVLQTNYSLDWFCNHLLSHRKWTLMSSGTVALWDIPLRLLLNSNLRYRICPQLLGFQMFWNFAKFQNDCATEMDVIDDWDFARFEFKMRFGDISDIAIVPWNGLWLEAMSVTFCFLASFCANEW